MGFGARELFAFDLHPSDVIGIDQFEKVCNLMHYLVMSSALDSIVPSMNEWNLFPYFYYIKCLTISHD